MEIEALYYPYARSFNRAMLKQAILIFDRIWFSDPVDRFFRELFLNPYKKKGSSLEQWNSIENDYEFLVKKKLVKIFNPKQIIKNYSGLIAQSVICDLKDDDFVQHVSSLAEKDHWAILREKIPAGDFLKQVSSFKGTRFWRKKVPGKNLDESKEIWW